MSQKKHGAYVGLQHSMETPDHHELNFPCSLKSNLDHKPLKPALKVHMMRTFSFMKNFKLSVLVSNIKVKVSKPKLLYTYNDLQINFLLIDSVRGSGSSF